MTINGQSLNISVIIVSYNSEKFLEKNLRSLVHQTVQFNRIVVIDNHSSDDSLKIIQSFREEVDIIPLSHNCGYAGAANIGIKHIYSHPGSGSHLLLVANSDIILDENFNARVKQASAVAAKSVPDFLTAWPIKFLSVSRMATLVRDAPTSTPV